MRKLEAFLEAMDQFGQVVEVFLNSTPFLCYVWVRILVKGTPLDAMIFT
jgi:hypothetical protein